jgi:hypothetical protein
VALTASIWHRPFSYLTAVAIFLLVIGISVMAIGLYIAADWASMRSCTNFNRYCPEQMTTAYLITASVLAFAVPSILGGILMLRRKKIGLYISMIALAMWTLFIAYGFDFYYAWFSNEGAIGWAAALSFVVVIAAMDTLFMIGRIRLWRVDVLR